MTETAAGWATPRASDFAQRYGIDDAGRLILIQLLSEAFLAGFATAEEDDDASLTPPFAPTDR